MYKTTDLNLACYLEMKKNPCDIERGQGNATFVFENVDQKLIDKYFENDGQFLDYANKLRNMKSRIQNQKREDINNG